MATSTELADAITCYLSGCTWGRLAVDLHVGCFRSLDKPVPSLLLWSAAGSSSSRIIEASSLKVMLQLAQHPKVAGQQLLGDNVNLRRAVKLLEAAAGGQACGRSRQRLGCVQLACTTR